MTTEALFKGVGVALLSLFTEDGELLVEETTQHAVRVVEAGCAAVLVAGTTGEAAALDPAERIELVSALRGTVAERIPVIAGTGAPSSRQAVRLTAEAIGAGADAVLVLSPPDAPDPRPYYDAVAKAAGGTPVLAYHYPQISPPGLSVEQLCDLPVAGCKDSSGDAARFLATTSAFPRALWAGSPALALLAGAVDAAGAILALANLAPEQCVDAWRGDRDAQVELARLHASDQAGMPTGLKQQVGRRYGTPVGARLG